MVRIAAIVLAFLVCVLAGSMGASRLTRRHAALQSLLRSGERAFCRAAATREPLLAVFAAERGAFSVYAQTISSGGTADTAAAAALETLGASLKDTDRMAANALFAAFSAPDTEQFKRRYTAAAAQLAACAGEAEHDKRDKAKLYRAMGVLCGTALAILLW